MALSNAKAKVIEHMNTVAAYRDKWISRNKYYYKDLIMFLKYNIPEGCTVLEIGCGTGYLLHSLKPDYGVGIDISQEMINIAVKNYPELNFVQMDAENINLEGTFDYIVISDTIGYFEDVQKAFMELNKVCHADTRVIITYQNFLWTPLFSIAEALKLKMPSRKLNWLSLEDICNLLNMADFEVVKTGRRFICPKYFPLISLLLNKYLAHLPGLNRLCITNFVITRVKQTFSLINDLTVSVIIPARNEKGNIENAIKRIPRMGKHVEIIFVEGHSNDGTLEEIKRVSTKYSSEWDIKYAVQDGKGKGDAVRKGFAMAKGQILMILDADLTVPPEDLPKFYDAIATGKGEYIQGSRLVYPMDKDAMRTLNMIGNAFFSIMFSWLLGQKLKDTLCGTKVIAKKNYDRLSQNRRFFGEFDPFGDFDLIFGSAKLNLKIVEIPIRYRAREYGETNIDRFRHGWLLIKMVFFAMEKIKFR